MSMNRNTTYLTQVLQVYGAMYEALTPDERRSLVEAALGCVLGALEGVPVTGSYHPTGSKEEA